MADNPNSKTTRRTLITSLLSTGLCCALMLGSSFAWFSDNADTHRNTIVAGNLDVKLMQVKFNGTAAADPQGKGEATEVKEGTTLLDDTIDWEPGHTQVVYLRVDNAGTMGIKYQLKVNATEENGATVKGKYNDDINLLKVLQIGCVDSDVPENGYSKREEAQQALQKVLNDTSGKMQLTASSSAEGANTKTINLEGTLTGRKNSNLIALVIYMPENTDNTANYVANSGSENKPKISISVDLLATQGVGESDSFDSNYDTAAPYPTVKSPETVLP